VIDVNMSMTDVEVEIVTAQFDEPTGNSSVGFVIANYSGTDRWVVTDKWFVWSLQQRLITLSFARARHRSGVESFGYFLPEVDKLSPGLSLTRLIVLEWPLVLSAIWNDQRSVWPHGGHYSLRIEIGYGTAPVPAIPVRGERLERIEEAILSWQRRAISNVADIMVPVRRAKN
jgi:hypothetical protein